MSHLSIFSKALVICYTVAMIRKTRILLALFAALFVLGTLPVQASYQDGLKLVRQGKWSRAILEFEQMVAANHAPSQFSLALIYHLGRGVPRDFEKAYNLYRVSSLQGHAPALNNIGMMYLNGEHVQKNQWVAFKLFERASAEHSQAKDNLGQCYQNGWGVEQDIGQAINFFELAGAEGYKLGYYHLAQIYEKGVAEQKVDMEEAVKWYEIAGEASYARGFYRLGEIYEEGIGIPPDKQAALGWYEKALDMDYTPAFTKVRELSN
ncbi:tetratricopeptide repeat protein [Magnetovibrio sp. PR-2]|uniref:tetratricopeptide repeat protein n=1 Tax=Magnetovibrio sp. PR-2 TaxID=3120356 RepID=UPI002FCE30F6